MGRNSMLGRYRQALLGGHLLWWSLLLNVGGALLAGCGGGGGGASSGNLTVIGTVLTVETDAPPNPPATVSIAGHSTTTSTNGAFTLTGIPASATTATVSAQGEQTLTLHLQLPSQSTQPVNLGTIFLSASGYNASVTGQIVTTVNGQNQPVGGATVTIGGSSTLSGSDGSFTISNLPVGLGNDPNIPIGSVSATGYVTKQIFVQAPLIAGVNPLGPISLGAPISSSVPGLPYTIIGKVLKNGQGQPNYPVILQQGSTVVGNTHTDSTGTFSFWVVPGSYTIVVFLPDGSSVTQPVTLQSTNQPVTQNVNLP
ncbi:Carboxypeptidase regulatory-like domain [Chthonomonas calidirosea]|uniref:Carboxypeptidase regulatory-like domain n=2 Tax=Chthonomonas TaxID=1077265 RepID=S0EVE5_CHTCT|nr:Carboxypeptidase regulatory-like domain [Chthonomonas calidirosea T49]CEK20429.1 Carboxypeptidase regulatory-like domain [Chthonomonas calidirosea]